MRLLEKGTMVRATVIAAIILAVVVFLAAVGAGWTWEEGVVMAAVVPLA